MGVSSSVLLLSPVTAGHLLEDLGTGAGAEGAVPSPGPAQEQTVVLVTLGSTVLSLQPLKHHHETQSGVQTWDAGRS